MFITALPENLTQSQVKEIVDQMDGEAINKFRYQVRKGPLTRNQREILIETDRRM